jgi:membrane protein implicated in regulation of membrane protease activity
VIYLFASFLYSQQATSHIRVSELVGCTGEVSVAIPKGGLGQVRCTLGDTVIEKIARARDNEEIPANTLVKIEEIGGESVIVRRVE